MDGQYCFTGPAVYAPYTNGGHPYFPPFYPPFQHPLQVGGANVDAVAWGHVIHPMARPLAPVLGLIAVPPAEDSGVHQAASGTQGPSDGIVEGVGLTPPTGVQPGRRYPNIQIGEGGM